MTFGPRTVLKREMLQYTHPTNLLNKLRVQRDSTTKITINFCVYLVELSENACAFRKSIGMEYKNV